jgi:hypothetical protein
MVQVHCDEGVANHIGPESRAVACKGGGEASVGERIGQPLSLENYILLGRRRVTYSLKLGLSYVGELARGAQDHSAKGSFTWNW